MSDQPIDEIALAYASLRCSLNRWAGPTNLCHQELELLWTEIGRLRAIVSGLADRVAAQSDLLSRKAEKVVDNSEKPMMKEYDFAGRSLNNTMPTDGGVDPGNPAATGR